MHPTAIWQRAEEERLNPRLRNARSDFELLDFERVDEKIHHSYNGIVSLLSQASTKKMRCSF